MASAWRRASRCSRSASGVSETSERIWKSSASSANWRSCSSTTRSSSRSDRRRAPTSLKRRSTEDLRTARVYERRATFGRGWDDGGADATAVRYTRRVPDAWSITEGYHYTGGGWHDTTDETRRALRAAMGAQELGDPDDPPAPPPMWFVRAGETSGAGLPAPHDLTLEDGTVVASVTELPTDLPLGYHTLTAGGGERVQLVVAPRQCPLPERAWGWAAQLYATRSERSWGIGDLRDLAELGRWSRSLGAGVVMINPLHANAPVEHQQPSPYFASSRVWRNVLYLCIEEVPGADLLGDELTALADQGHALNRLDGIDRDAVFALKNAALGRLFESFEERALDRDGFERWREAQGEDLLRFATYCTIAERHGQVYQEWPSGLRHPEGADVARLQQDEGERIRFHSWCQWLLERQVERAGAAGVAVMSDLAVGFDRCGADGWTYQDLLALDCRVGAPPDTFNPSGQDWGLPPFIPWKLRAAGYGPFIATLRASFGGGGGIRIDHVMGLFRLFWLPPGGGATDGAYVRYPADDLLHLVALEAARAGAFVVGEDLGTIEDEAREALMEHAVLSYRLLWFEEGRTADFPTRALASITTHDLPTVAGVWTGADLGERRAIGRDDDGSDVAHYRQKLVDATGRPTSAPLHDVILEAHRALADTPSLLVLATLDDAIGAPLRPNIPGTVDERPNWRLPLPATIEELESHPLAAAVAAILDAGVRGGPGGGDGPGPRAAAAERAGGGG